jgi:hypothetical protein
MNTTERTREQIAAVDAVLIGAEIALDDVRGLLAEMASPTPRTTPPSPTPRRKGD